MNATRQYDYLIKSREKVIAAIRPLTPVQYRHEFAFGLKSVASTITHIMISEWYYVERLMGQPVPPYEAWPIKYENPPEFAVVESHWSKQQARIAHVVAGETDWSRSVRYETFGDEAGRRFIVDTPASDVFTQLVLHEVHHRAQVMAMLRMLGAAVVEDIDFNTMMYRMTPLK